MTKHEWTEELLTAYALGELSETERADVERALEKDPEARAAMREIQKTAEMLEGAYTHTEEPQLAMAQRDAIEGAASANGSGRGRYRIRMVVAAAATAAVLAGVVLWPGPRMPREATFEMSPEAVEAQNLVAQLPEGYERFLVTDLNNPAAPTKVWNWEDPDDQAEIRQLAQQFGIESASGVSDSVSQLAWRPVTERAESLSQEEVDQLKALGYETGPTRLRGLSRGAAADVGRLTPSDISRIRALASIGVRSNPQASPGTEDYQYFRDSGYVRVADKPLSTFSIDVDTASYSNVRRYLEQDMLPPPDAVRVEELINYFDYSYAPPEGQHPFAAHIEVARSPWNAEHKLVRIGLKGEEIGREERPPSNLVFLLDVSGSMRPENKLPLLQRGISLLAAQLDERDRVAIVTYATGTRLALPSTSGHEKARILGTVNGLAAGGSTNGSGGIQLAYRIARENYLEGGVNRVILCTDGDFNVGITNRSHLIRLIETEATSGVFLSVFGFGMGNLKDATLEQLADKGNGHYGYVDTYAEARKLFAEQLTGTLVTIAKDVKVQVEFNPQHVSAYRLIGYENRALAARDFNDDTKDAGEIGAGHTVTALYEIVPPGAAAARPGVDPLRYQEPEPAATVEETQFADELLMVKLRYKEPDEETSKLLEFAVANEDKPFQAASADFRFAVAVATFGGLLRESSYTGELGFAEVLSMARSGLDNDRQGYRSEFITIVRKAQRSWNILKRGFDGVEVEVLMIREVRGEYKVRIRTGRNTGWYGVNEGFEDYTLLSVDPDTGCCQIFANRLGRVIERCVIE